MTSTYRFSPASKKAFQTAVKNKPELRQKLRHLVTTYQITTLYGEKLNARAHTIFLLLNEIVALEISSSEVFKEAKQVFNNSMMREPFSNARSDFEFNTIEAFHSFAALAYTLGSSNNARADLEAREMWNQLKRFYSKYYFHPV